MNEELFLNFYKTAMKMIENSNYIEKFYKNLAQIELEKGSDSKEYIQLKENIISGSLKELDLLNEILDSPFCLFFREIISDNDCKRLIDKLNNEYDFSRIVIEKTAEDRYEKDKNRVGKYITKDDFIKIDYEELGKHILRHNIFNTIQSKTYIKVLDEYIKNIDDENLKKSLIEEKYSLITRDSALEDWYFGLGRNNDCMLIDNDRIVAFELGLSLDEYLRLKNNYFEDVVNDCIDFMLENSNKDNNSKTIYEINMIAAILCMNTLYIYNSYNFIENNIEKNPDLYDQESIEFIDDIFSKWPELEKKLRIKCPYKEV